MDKAWGYLRQAIEKVIDMVAKCSENLVIVGHVKDKAIVDAEGRDAGSIKDFDLSGKYKICRLRK